MTKEDNQFVFLDDYPSLEDGFSGKGHERSADVLVYCIENAKSNKTIGLEGSWGSGKSTVVAIAEEKLNEAYPSKYQFFTFDLWAYQGLDFRRAFLEGFLDWARKHISCHEHNNFKDRVLGKTRVVNTKNERQFSVFGYVFIIVVFLLPFFVLWLSPFAANLHNSNPLGESNSESFPYIYGFLFEYGHCIAVSLLVLLMAAWCFQVFNSHKKVKNLRKAIDSSFTLFLSRSETDTVIQSIREGDPTKYEFSKIFSELVSKIQEKNTQIIFIFDNIDRLSEQQIQEVWSHIRAVITQNFSQQVTPKIIAVIPYDRKQTLLAFKKIDVVSNWPEDKKNSDYVLEDIFRKTFDAIVSVAPPIASNLNYFFNKCLDQANLSHFDANKRYKLFQIYDTYLTEQKTNPTPRQIKTFINEVGLLHLQWKEKISVISIAIFVLHRTLLEGEPKSLQNQSTIKNRYRHFAAKDNLTKELAALIYNIEPDVAIEILLKRDIKAAFIDTDSKAILELEKTPGFQEQIDAILADVCNKWAESDIYDFGNGLENFIALSKESSLYRISATHFIESVSSLKAFNIEDWEKHTNLFRLVELTDDWTNLLTIARKLVSMVEISDENLLTFEAGRNWIKFVGGFLQAIKKHHGNNIYKSLVSNIKIPDSPDFYLGVALDCDEVDLLFNDFAGFSESEIIATLEALKTYAVSTPKYFSYVWKQLVEIFSNEDKLEVFKCFLEKVNTETLEDGDLREIYFNNLALVAKDCYEFESLIIEAISAGALTWHAQKLHDSDNQQAMVNTLWLAAESIRTREFPRLKVNSQPPFGELGNSYSWFKQYYLKEAPEELLHELARMIINHQAEDEWLSRVMDKPSDSLHLNVTELAFLQASCPPPNFNLFYENYSVIKECFSEKLVNKLLVEEGEGNDRSVLDKIRIDDTPLELLADTLERKENLWKDLHKNVVKYINELDEENWAEMLGSDNINRKIFNIVAVKLVNKVPPNYLRPALADFIATKLEGSAYELSALNKFWDVLSTASQKGVAQDILEKIRDVSTDKDSVIDVLEFFPKLSKQINPAENIKVCVKKLLFPLLSGSEDKALEMINAQPEAWIKAVGMLDDDSREQLVDFLEEDEEESESTLSNIRKILKV